MQPLSGFLKRFVQRGTLRVFDADGRLHTFSGTPEPTVTLRIHKKSLYFKLFFKGELYLPEAYMDETLTFEEGSSLLDFLQLFSINRDNFFDHPMQKMMKYTAHKIRRFTQYNPLGQAMKNVSGHYDISDELYHLFLDDDLQYTCGYYRTPQDTLEEAQANKMRHVAAKLGLEDGMKVAELGCGWGGFALYLAQIADIEITAVSLSGNQIKVAKARAKEMGLDHRVHFKHMDYRELEGKYDRVVSVGMLEHLGAKFYDEFFGRIRELVTEDGYAFIHSNGRSSPPGATSPFLQKYIFPHGYSPAVSEVFAAAERQDIWIGDCEILRLHYYYTIKHWYERFMANWDKAAEMYDERFCRMWEFYLLSVMVGFSHGTSFIFQMVVAPTRDAIPIVRDYMVDAERKLEAHEQKMVAE